VAFLRKTHKSANGVQNFCYQTVGSIEIVPANEFPDLVQVKAGFWVKFIRDHESGSELRAAWLFSRK
jgi:hypothetical protein